MHYYIFGVRSERTRMLISKLSLDFVIEYTDKDIDNANLAEAITKNELFPVSVSEANKACDLSRLGQELLAAKYMINANNLTVHKVTSECKLEREDLRMFVDCCNNSNESLKKLKEAEIRI